MSRVTVQFYGICTHVKTDDGRHRVILPNAGAEQIDRHHVLTRQRIQPHIARLQIQARDLVPGDHHPDQSVRTWILDGTTLSIDGAVAPQAPAEQYRGAFPSLNAYCCSGVKLRQECRESGAQATSDLAACFFDFPAVTPVAYRVSDDDDEEGYRATVGVVTVETIENVTRPVISMKTPSGENVSISVQDGAQITVFSYPEPVHGQPSADKDADFLLHFLSATKMPDGSWFPPASPWEECPKAIDTYNAPRPLAGGAMFTGPGCSNSTYP